MHRGQHDDIEVITWVIMPAVHIRDVDEAVLAALREAARENDRSLNAELVATARGTRGALTGSEVR